MLTYTITGFQGTDTVAVVSGAAGLSTAADTNSGVGTYPITITNLNLSASNYGFNFSNNTLQVNPAGLLVSADNQSRAYGATNPVLTYTITGFQGTDTVAVVSGTAGLSTAADTNSPYGTYPIVVTNINLSASNYGFSFTNGTLTVGQATLLVSADNQSRAYGATNPVLTYTITGFQGTDTVAVVSGAPLLGTMADTNSGVGTYPITITNLNLSASNYGFNFSNGTLQVNPATLLVSADNRESGIWGDEPGVDLHDHGFPGDGHGGGGEWGGGVEHGGGHEQPVWDVSDRGHEHQPECEQLWVQLYQRDAAGESGGVAGECGQPEPGVWGNEPGVDLHDHRFPGDGHGGSGEWGAGVEHGGGHEQPSGYRTRSL